MQLDLKDPRLLRYLATVSGAPSQPAAAAPVEQPPEAPPAPPPAATVPPPDAAAPPQSDPLTEAYKGFAATLDPERLNAAIQQQRSLQSLGGLEQGMNRAAMLIGRLPSQAQQTPQWDAVKEYMLRQQQAQARLGAQVQVAQMSPDSPLFQAKLEGLRRAGVDVRGITSPMQADALMAGLEAGGKQSKLAADTAAAQGSAASSFASAAAKPQEVTQGWARLGQERDLKVKELDQALDIKKAEMAQAVTLKRWDLAQSYGLEIAKLQNERDMFAIKNPRQITPDEYYAGAGVPPDKLRDPTFINSALTVPKEVLRKIGEAKAIQQRLEKAGPQARLSSDDLARLRAVYPMIVDATARKMAGGQAPTQQVIEQAHSQIPEPSAIRDTAMLSRFMAAADQVAKDTQMDLEESRRGMSLKEGRDPNGPSVRPVGMVGVVMPDGTPGMIPAARLAEFTQNYPGARIQ